jgi:hypothetical protein
MPRTQIECVTIDIETEHVKYQLLQCNQADNLTTPKGFQSRTTVRPVQMNVHYYYAS